MCDDYDDECQEYEYENDIDEDCYDADYIEDDGDDDACYDNGDYCDDDGACDDVECNNDYDYIPTYDELDLEGRYYLYGSRSEYNKWRNEQINTVRGGAYRGNTAYSGNSGCMVTLVFFVIIFIISTI